MQNNTSQNILQEIRFDEKIKIMVSDYAIVDKLDDKLQKTIINDNTPKFDSIKLSCVLELDFPALITGLNFITKNLKMVSNNFKILEIEGSNIEENSYFNLLGSQEYPPNRESLLNFIGVTKNNMKISCYGILKNLKISFLVCKNIIKDNNNLINQSYHKTRMKKKLNPLDDLKNLENEIYDLHEEDDQQCCVRDKLDELEEDDDDNDGDGNDEEGDYDDWDEFFKQNYDAVQVFGYNLLVSPPASQFVALLNIANTFKKYHKIDEAIETQILFGLSLINARRFVQAAEILRKASLYLINKSDVNKLFNQNNTDISCKNKAYNDFQNKLILPKETANSSKSPNTTSIISPGFYSKDMLRAAKLEIIIADAINQHSMINEKVEALQKAVEYYLGQKNFLGGKISPNLDVYSALLKLSPVLCKFLSKCLSDLFEPLRIAAIRNIEFLIEELGCSIGGYLPQILKSILETYPSQYILISNSPNEPNIKPNNNNNTNNALNGFDTSLCSGNNPNNTNNNKDITKDDRNIRLVYTTKTPIHQNTKLMIDIYNHLLENVLNVLPLCSAKILHKIFQELLLPRLFTQEIINQELNIYFLRITEKILCLCQGDLILNNNFYSNMISLIDSSSINIKLVAQQLWDTIKNKIINNLDNKNMNNFIEWITESLNTLLENDNISNSNNITYIDHLLDLIKLICNREKILYNDELANFSIKATNNLDNHTQQANLSSSSASSLFRNKINLMNKSIVIGDPINLRLLVKPLILWLEHIVNDQNTKLEKFKIVWNILTDLLDIINIIYKQNEIKICDIALPLLWKVCKYCELSSPTLQMLNFLILVLSSIKEQSEPMKDFLRIFLSVFTECIPHSIHDESFQVFDLLVKLSLNIFTESLIEVCHKILFFHCQLLFSFGYTQKCIMALIDQYTMKGKIQKQSKENFISLLMQQDSAWDYRELKTSLFYNALRICLIDNIEPNEANITSLAEIISTYSDMTNRIETSKKCKEYDSFSKNNFDSKKLMKLHESFIEKLTFAHEILSQIKENNFPILYLILNDILQNVFQRLILSGNSKVRMKCLEMIHLIIEAYHNYRYLRLNIMNSNEKKAQPPKLLEDSLTIMNNNTLPQFEIIKKDDIDDCVTTSKLLCSRFALNILKLAFETCKDPKLHYKSLNILHYIFETFLQSPKLPKDNDNDNLQSTNSQETDEKYRHQLDFDNLTPFTNLKINLANEVYLNFRLQQIFKFWPLLQNLISSTWSSIRNLSLSLINKWVHPNIVIYTYYELVIIPWFEQSLYNQSNQQKKFKSFVFQLLMILLTNKESDIRFQGLKILGALCGMQSDLDCIGNDLSKILGTFQKMANNISLAIWEIVFDLQVFTCLYYLTKDHSNTNLLLPQRDWNANTREAANILIQLAAPRDAINHFYKLKKEGHALKYANNQFINQIAEKNKLNLSYFLQCSTEREIQIQTNNPNNNNNNNNDDSRYEPKQDSLFDVRANAYTIQSNYPKSGLKLSNLMDEIPTCQVIQNDDHDSFPSFNASLEESNKEIEEIELFWLENCTLDILKESLSIFKIEVKISTNNIWLDNLINKEGIQYDKNGDNNNNNNEKYYYEADEVPILRDNNNNPNSMGYSIGSQGRSQDISGNNNNNNNGNGGGGGSGNGSDNENNKGNCGGKKNLDDDIDFEELGIIEIEDGDDEIMDFNYDTQKSKNFSRGFNRVKKNFRDTTEANINIESHDRIIEKKSYQMNDKQMNFKNNLVNENRIPNKAFDDDLRNFNCIIQEEVDSASEEPNTTSPTTIEKASLRPQNLLFRPLTPPVRNPLVCEVIIEQAIECITNQDLENLNNIKTKNVRNMASGIDLKEEYSSLVKKTTEEEQLGSPKEEDLQELGSNEKFQENNINNAEDEVLFSKYSSNECSITTESENDDYTEYSAEKWNIEAADEQDRQIGTSPIIKFSHTLRKSSEKLNNKNRYTEDNFDEIMIDCYDKQMKNERGYNDSLKNPSMINEPQIYIKSGLQIESKQTMIDNYVRKTDNANLKGDMLDGSNDDKGYDSKGSDSKGNDSKGSDSKGNDKNSKKGKDKEKKKGNDKDNTKDKGNDKDNKKGNDKDNDKSNNKDNNRGNGKDNNKGNDKDNSKGNDKDNNKGNGKDSSKGNDKGNNNKGNYNEHDYNYNEHDYNGNDNDAKNDYNSEESNSRMIFKPENFSIIDDYDSNDYDSKDTKDKDDKSNKGNKDAKNEGNKDIKDTKDKGNKNPKGAKDTKDPKDKANCADIATNNTNNADDNNDDNPLNTPNHSNNTTTTATITTIPTNLFSKVFTKDKLEIDTDHIEDIQLRCINPALHADANGDDNTLGNDNNNTKYEDKKEEIENRRSYSTKNICNSEVNSTGNMMTASFFMFPKSFNEIIALENQGEEKKSLMVKGEFSRNDGDNKIQDYETNLGKIPMKTKETGDLPANSKGILSSNSNNRIDTVISTKFITTRSNSESRKVTNLNHIVKNPNPIPKLSNTINQVAKLSKKPNNGNNNNIKQIEFEEKANQGVNIGMNNDNGMIRRSISAGKKTNNSINQIYSSQKQCKPQLRNIISQMINKKYGFTNTRKKSLDKDKKEKAPPKKMP